MLKPIGKPFGVREGRTLKRRLFVVCECDCGGHYAVRRDDLKRGLFTHCGCQTGANISRGKIQHGYTRRGRHHPLYAVLNSMKQRCQNPKNDSYKNYGARGISVCEEWRGNPAAFIEWSLAHGWGPGLEIDRIDNDGNYEPGNCRWVDRDTNANNKRSTLLLTAFGETKALSDWASDGRCVVSRKTLWKRVRAGRDPEEAITTPSTQRECEDDEPEDDSF